MQAVEAVRVLHERVAVGQRIHLQRFECGAYERLALRLRVGRAPREAATVLALQGRAGKVQCQRAHFAAQ
eukprot:843617-Prymnesium_polylepis.2